LPSGVAAAMVVAEEDSTAEAVVEDFAVAVAGSPAAARSVEAGVHFAVAGVHFVAAVTSDVVTAVSVADTDEDTGAGTDSVSA
jgi:hypothetical protein